MMRSFSAAVSGLRTHQTYLDTVANDIANVNTLGYKSNRFNFKDAFNQTLRAAGGAGTMLGSVNAQQVGLGVEIGSIDNQMQQGPIQSTGNPFDLAIQGDGFFRVSNDKNNPASSLFYTRAGNFTLDEEGYLTTQDGLAVVGCGFIPPVPPAVSPTPDTTVTQRLQVPTDARSVNIDQNGLVAYIDSAGAMQYSGYVTLAKFPNASGLTRAASNLWTESQSSGAAVPDTPTRQGLGALTSRSLEMSNVDISYEFAEMIKAQRGFQVNSRTITTADDMLQTLVQMKR